MASTEAKQLILRYVLTHPDACDAIEGIVNFWIMRQKVDENIDEVMKVVQELVEESVLVVRPGHDGRSIYSVNKATLEGLKVD